MISHSSVKAFALLALLKSSSMAAPCPRDSIAWPSREDKAVYECQAVDAAQAEATLFLLANMPSWDATNVETLFGQPDGVDGLDDGIASLGVNYSLAAKSEFSWGPSVPKDIWDDYVLPYANTNEARNNWRPLLHDALAPLLTKYNAATIDDAASIVNGYTNANESLWTVLTMEPITFHSSQTPLIYDPLSVITFGYASCTGISVLFVDALRSVGVPARVVGTPAWNGDAANGNHNWVEVWRGDDLGWSFIEGKPAGGGETLDDPCNKWFCTTGHFGTPGTEVYAAKWSQGDISYPMSWDLRNTEVPGVNRTDYYLEACGAC